MERGILGSRALRVAYACALALGIAPAAAQGAADGGNPPATSTPCKEVMEDISGDGEALPSDETAPDEQRQQVRKQTGTQRGRG